CRRADAAHRVQGRRLRTGWGRVWRACSSTELDGDRLPAAHQRDRPAAGGFCADPCEIARTRILLVFYGCDHIALLETEILSERPVGALDHHAAFGRRIEP